VSFVAQTFWALIATVTMTGIMQAAQGLGLSRMSLPFLFGTWFTDNRAVAMVVGAVFSLIGGWIFALGYLFVFMRLEVTSWWFGPLLGFVHGLFLLLILLPALPYCHPRIATEYDRPTSRRRIEPPGFLGLNYGVNTPLVTLIAQTAYGGVLAFGFLR
jgi:uncharacterized membrane protein YagU involved in acid resistance